MRKVRFLYLVLIMFCLCFVAKAEIVYPDTSYTESDRSDTSFVLEDGKIFKKVSQVNIKVFEVENKYLDFISDSVDASSLSNDDLNRLSKGEVLKKVDSSKTAVKKWIPTKISKQKYISVLKVKGNSLVRVDDKIELDPLPDISLFVFVISVLVPFIFMLFYIKEDRKTYYKGLLRFSLITITWMAALLITSFIVQKPNMVFVPLVAGLLISLYNEKIARRFMIKGRESLTISLIVVFGTIMIMIYSFKSGLLYMPNIKMVVFFYFSFFIVMMSIPILTSLVRDYLLKKK